MAINMLNSINQVKQQSEKILYKTQNVQLRMLISLSTSAIMGINLHNSTKLVNTTKLKLTFTTNNVCC